MESDERNDGRKKREIEYEGRAMMKAEADVFVCTRASNIFSRGNDVALLKSKCYTRRIVSAARARINPVAQSTFNFLCTINQNSQQKPARLFRFHGRGFNYQGHSFSSPSRLAATK